MVDQVLGWTATTIFSLMLVPQIVKTLRTRTLKGVSLWMYVLYFVGNCVAICYAGMIHQGPLVIKYAIALVTTAFFFIAAVYSVRSEND